MNERIKELWDKAADSTAAFSSGQNNSWETQVNFMERFAELIVRECVKIALDERVVDEEIDKSDDIEDRCYLRGNNGGIVDAVVAIKQHFGVEE